VRAIKHALFNGSSGTALKATYAAQDADSNTDTRLKSVPAHAPNQPQSEPEEGRFMFGYSERSALLTPAGELAELQNIYRDAQWQF